MDNLIENPKDLEGILSKKSLNLKDKARLRASYTRLLELSKQAEYDELTGLHNRRKFNEDFLMLISDANRKGTKPMALIHIDVDDFKQYNDDSDEKHVLGDKVLKKVAQALNKSIRKVEGSVNRTGGDEFSLLVRYDRLEKLIDTVVRVQKKINDTCKIYKDSNGRLYEVVGGNKYVSADGKLHAISEQDKNNIFSATISIGIATYKPETDQIAVLSDFKAKLELMEKEAETLYKKADKAGSASKREIPAKGIQGKNKAKFYIPLSEIHKFKALYSTSS